MSGVAAIRTIASLSLLWLGIVRADVDADMARGIMAYERGDVVGALQAFRGAAEQGHAPAQLRLARILHRSDQIAEAMPWYRRAADQRDGEARFALAELYLTGEAGEKDLSMARAWMFGAAADGYRPAVRALITGFEQGRMELPVDPELALFWRRRLDGADTEGSARSPSRGPTDTRERETEMDDGR